MLLNISWRASYSKDIAGLPQNCRYEVITCLKYLNQRNAPTVTATKTPAIKYMPKSNIWSQMFINPAFSEKPLMDY